MLASSEQNICQQFRTLRRDEATWQPTTCLWKCSTISFLCYYSSRYMTVVVLAAFLRLSLALSKDVWATRRQGETELFTKTLSSMDQAAASNICIIVVSNVGVVVVVGAMTHLHASVMKANTQLAYKARLSANNPSGLLNTISFSAEAVVVGWASHRGKCFVVGKYLQANDGRWTMDDGRWDASVADGVSTAISKEGHCHHHHQHHSFINGSAALRKPRQRLMPGRILLSGLEEGCQHTNEPSKFQASIAGAHKLVCVYVCVCTCIHKVGCSNVTDMLSEAKFWYKFFYFI